MQVCPLGAVNELRFIRIGDTSFTDYDCLIAGIFGRGVAGTNAPVIVDNNGKLGTQVSSRRFKHDIKAMEKASQVILALKPATFHYNSDETNTRRFGLIAEEVAEVSPDLMLPDKEENP